MPPLEVTPQATEREGHTESQTSAEPWEVYENFLLPVIQFPPEPAGLEAQFKLLTTPPPFPIDSRRMPTLPPSPSLAATALLRRRFRLLPRPRLPAFISVIPLAAAKGFAACAATLEAGEGLDRTSRREGYTYFDALIFKNLTPDPKSDPRFPM